MWPVPSFCTPAKLSSLSKQPGAASRPGLWQQTSGMWFTHHSVMCLIHFARGLETFSAGMTYLASL